MVNIYFPSNTSSTANTPGISGSAATTSGASADPTRILLNKLAEQIPGMTADQFSALDPTQFTPQRVADKISGFVASGLDAAKARGASDDRLQQMYDAALSGVQKGFDEAKKTLKELNLLSGQVADQVKDTEQKTADALKAIAPGARTSAQDSTGDGSAVAGVSVAERYRNAESMVLDVVTQDGDKVQIRFDHQQSQDGTLAAAADSNGNAVASYSLSRSESSSYRFSVKGNLDSGEIDALQNLVKDVSSLANEFYNGDIQKALSSSSKLSFDGSELSSMHLSMQYSRQQAVATSSYQQVQSLDQPVDKPGRRLGQLMKDLAGQANAPSLGFLAAPGQLVKQLYANLVQQDSRYHSATDEGKQRYQDNLAKLLSGLNLSGPSGGTTEAVAPDTESN